VPLGVGRDFPGGGELLVTTPSGSSISISVMEFGISILIGTKQFMSMCTVFT